jgi:hypothetical protein
VTLGIQGEPIVYRAPEIVAESDIFVRPLDVELKAPSSGVEIRYSLDGSDPEAGSAVYREPLRLSATTVLSARSFHLGKPVSSVTRRRFERVAVTESCFPGITPTQPGVTVMRYSGNWDELPDFAQLQPTATEVVPRIRLEESQRGEFCALRFVGFLDVPESDVYRFSLASDDGSELWINGERVIDNDGLHGTLEKRANVALGRGPANGIEVRWFNKTGGAELDLRWAPLGGEWSPVEGLTHSMR